MADSTLTAETAEIEPQPPIAPSSDMTTRQFGLNVASNIALVVLNAGVALWFTPYLIGMLGIGLFGVTGLANSLAIYVMVINSAVTSAVGRYLSIHVRRGETEAANRTFNTALYLSLLVTAAALPFIGLASWALPSWFDIPPGHEMAAMWLFGISMTTAIAVMVRGVFMASAFARNRLDMQNLVLAANVIIRIAVTITLFAVAAAPSLWEISWGLVAGAVFSFALAVAVWRRLTPELHIDRHAFDRTQWRSLSGMSGWLAINLVGSTLLLNIDLVIVNRLLGVTAQGRYASVWQWALLMHTLARTVASALMPITLSQYAAGDLGRMKTVAYQAVKLLGLALALPVGLLLAFATPLLLAWLGPAFADLAPLLRVLSFHLAINLAVAPLLFIQVAVDRVVWPALVTLGSGLLNVALAFWWGGQDALGIGVALAAATALTLRSVVFTPIYSARIQGLPWHTFYPALLLTVLGTATATALGVLLLRVWPVAGWLPLIVAVGIVSVLYGMLVFFVLLTRDDRRLVGRFLPGRLRAWPLFGGNG